MNLGQIQTWNAVVDFGTIVGCPGGGGFTFRFGNVSDPKLRAFLLANRLINNHTANCDPMGSLWVSFDVLPGVAQANNVAFLMH